MKLYTLFLTLTIFLEIGWHTHAMRDEGGGSEEDGRPAPQVALTEEKAWRCINDSSNRDQEIAYSVNQLENRFQSPIVPDVPWWCDGEAIRLLRQSYQEVFVQPLSPPKEKYLILLKELLMQAPINLDAHSGFNFSYWARKKLKQFIEDI